MSSQLGGAQLGHLQLGDTSGSTPSTAIQPASVTSEEAWGSPGLFSNALYPDGIASGETWGTPTITGAIAPSGIATGETWGTPSIVDLNIRPTGISSEEAWGRPALADRNVRVLGGIPSEEAWGIPALLSGDMSELFTKDSVTQWIESTVRISKAISQPNKCTFDYIYKVGRYRPRVGDPVRFYWDGELRFGGLILEWSESNIPGNFDKTRITVTCTGYQALTDRIIIAKLYTLSLGGIPGIIVYDIWQKKLYPTFGITKYNNNDDGASVVVGDMLFHYITCTEALNQVVDKEPGWNWWIDDYKSLHHENTLAKSPDAPFSITDATKNVDKITVTQTGRKKRNSQWVLPSADLNGLLEESHIGDGTTQAFPTDYTLDAAPLIQVDGDEKVVFQFGSGPWPDDWEWYYIPGGIGVFARSAPGTGQVIDVRYPCPFPIAFNRKNTTDITTNGLWESAFQSQNITTEQDAESAAQGLVDLYTEPGSDTYPSVIKYEYNSEHQPLWLTPGMVVSVNRTFPDVVGNFIVDSVDSAEQELTVFRHSVTLRNQAGDVDEERFINDLLSISRTQVVSKIIPATFEPDINGFGLILGFSPQRAVVQNPGVIASWDALFAISPPVGADIIIECYLNGTSIFASTDPDKIKVPDGVSTLVTGYRFASANISVKKGDILAFQITQIGSTLPGSYGVVHINVKV